MVLKLNVFKVNPCTLPSDTGICKALMQRYFYNSNTKMCETFTYGGKSQ